MDNRQHMAQKLIESYAQARYRISLPREEIDVAIGRRAERLEQLLPATRYTVITAFNPGSRCRSEQENRSANLLLRTCLDSLNVVLFPSVASDAEGGWREPGWLAADLDLPRTDELARRFGQAGILRWNASQPVRLRLYLPPVPTLGMPWLEWAHHP